MRIHELTVIAASVAGALLTAVPPVHAQSTRTWVAQPAGDDDNPCSLTAPCRTFAGAISKTAAGGEISVFSPGGYGSLVITKSISINAIGPEASVLGSDKAPGILVNAQPNDAVFLNGVVFEGAGVGMAGIRILSAGSVHIRNCVIRGFMGAPGLAIDIAPTAAVRVFVSNCALTHNNGGIQVAPSDKGSAQVFVDGVQLDGHAGNAISAQGKSATVRLNRSTITGNMTGLDSSAGGSIISFGNNAVSGNATEGRPTVVQSLN